MSPRKWILLFGALGIAAIVAVHSHVAADRELAANTAQDGRYVYRTMSDHPTALEVSNFNEKYGWASGNFDEIKRQVGSPSQYKNHVENDDDDLCRYHCGGYGGGFSGGGPQ